ncbi:MAG: hypothetical protein MUE85_03205 [Microscillaceae bacterium]|nr:hypothetical protein [Microscillaceae bacterium]
MIKHRLTPFLLIGGGLLLGLTAIFNMFFVPINSVKARSYPPQVKSSKIADTILRDAEATAVSKLLAALPISDSSYSDWQKSAAVRTHQTEFNKSWTNLESKKLEKMRTWRDKELVVLNNDPHNLFYPFSGPDFLNAYELFPNCENYLLFGLEKVGELPTAKTLKGAFLQNYLLNIRYALSEIFQRNYFITARMSGAFNTNLKGVLPILAVFLARTDNEIIKIQKIFLEKSGKLTYTSLGYQSKFNLVWGVCIEFKNKNKNSSQKLYYFGTDLANEAMTVKTELTKFIQSFGQKIALTKSASYLMHTANFTHIRDLILTDTQASLQDDTGVPYKYFIKAGWQAQLYGKYDKPIRDFNYGYQPDLMQVYQQNQHSIPAIDFTFGYHWWTDKSGILYFTKGKE